MSHLVSIQILDGQFPFSLFVNPFHLQDFLLRFQMFINTILSSHALPVITNFVSLCKLLGPLGVGLKVGLIYVCRNIATDAGIRILIPSSALLFISHKAFAFKKYITITHNVSILVVYCNIDTRQLCTQQSRCRDS